MMVIGGLAMVVLPALRMRANEHRDAATADQIRRIDEFEADLAAGDIDPEISAALRDELERAVIDAVPVADLEPSAGDVGPGTAGPQSADRRVEIVGYSVQQGLSPAAQLEHRPPIHQRREVLHRAVLEEDNGPHGPEYSRGAGRSSKAVPE